MKGRQNLLGFKHTKETLNKLKELQLNNWIKNILKNLRLKWEINEQKEN
jgi:hypothetical protein